MFSDMVSPDALENLGDNADSSLLSGEEREATMFFSSIHGFVPIAETLDPQSLARLVNCVHSRMTDIIIENHGYVDKYVGDAIMAAWGVPGPIQDQAKLACWAALDCQEKMLEMHPELKSEFGVDLRIRMGLNSGQVIAGNMGSEHRFSYTVMGEAVNHAARFECTNKDYDTSIIIGEKTYEAAREHIEARLLDVLVLKGNAGPLKVYELISKRGQLSRDMQAVIDLYSKGLRLHWVREWDDALACFEELLRIRPDDGPAKRMLHRMRANKESPPETMAE
jgi:adenylate cyclase